MAYIGWASVAEGEGEHIGQKILWGGVCNMNISHVDYITHMLCADVANSPSPGCPGIGCDDIITSLYFPLCPYLDYIPQHTTPKLPFISLYG